MDLNSSYFQHQLLLMRAARARTASCYANHLVQADAVASQIAGFQRSTGAAAAGTWTADCVSKQPVRREMCA